jgi:hypothetical protein
MIDDVPNRTWMKTTQQQQPQQHHKVAAVVLRVQKNNGRKDPNSEMEMVRLELVVVLVETIWLEVVLTFWVLAPNC